MDTNPEWIDRTRCKELKTAMKAGKLKLSGLSAGELEFVKSRQFFCGNCRKRFYPYDARQGRIRQYCSDECSRESRRTWKWECAICRDRFRRLNLLECHLDKKHPEVDRHQYLRTYWELKGYDVSELQRYCLICGHERRVNLKSGRYDECSCVSLERNLDQLKKDYVAATLPEERKQLGRRIGGTRARLNNIRQNTERSLAEPVATDLKMSGNNSGMTCTWMEGLYSLGGDFTRLLEERRRVYDAFYTLIEQFERVGLTNSLTVSANERLHCVLKSDFWSQHDSAIEDNSVQFRLWALDKTALEQGNAQWIEFRLRVDCNIVAIEKLRSSIKADKDAVIKALNEMRDAFEFPLHKNVDAQCWQRMIVIMNGREEWICNPMAVLKIYKWMNRMQA
ncbi:MAG: hypothetical protein A2283_15780 [Lentisphaerae bacterium RIFOXYA12_FULL_48_11]|nr:MAG: hypothetical protein A2283_15780 [Lentisphaerae bacterium RIFOXYA12_FULL_48_11]